MIPLEKDSTSILSHSGYCTRSNPTQATRKSHTTQPTPQKYCSDRCRREKPRPAPSTEKDIEQTFTRLLGGGGERRIVKCEDVERAVFTKSRTDDDGASGDDVEILDAGGQGEDGRSNSGEEAEDNDDDDGDGGVRLPSDMDPAVTSTSTKPKSEDGSHHKTLREWGMQKAKEREMVRRAARRGVAFGFEMEGGKRRWVEAVQRGRVVESSFAKGEWGVRWRE